MKTVKKKEIARDVVCGLTRSNQEQFIEKSIKMLTDRQIKKVAIAVIDLCDSFVII